MSPVWLRLSCLCALLVTLCSALSHDTQSKVSNLWEQVEQIRPVKYAHRRQVIDTPPHIDIGSDPTHDSGFQTKTSIQSRIDHLKFNKKFTHGVASAAAQVEGAVKDDGRGPSLWDSYCHLVTPDNANVTCHSIDIGTNFRYLYPLDLARVAAMGMESYSFSVSWSRVFPMGYGEMSQEGLQFYIDLVDAIVAQGMKPVATLFHWDLPLQLELHYGGFSNERIADDFARYAGVIFKALNDRGVRTWFTFNEPQVFCLQRYPLIQPHVYSRTEADPALPWQCAGNLLKAHGKAVALFRQMKKDGKISRKAKISYKNAGSYNALYRKDNKQDQLALKRGMAFYMGLFAKPIHKTGDYPAVVKEEVPKKWLPELTAEDQKRLKGSADFFATDFYSTSITKATELDGGFDACVGNVSHPAWPSCSDYTATMPDGQLIGEKSDALTESWLMNTAGTLRRHLKYIHDRYNIDEIQITEIGWAERGEADKKELSDLRNDAGRQRYFRDHLAEMLLAVYKDGVPLTACYIWSATSNIEWELGRGPRFGIQSVNYTDPDLKRTYLGSFFLIKKFFQEHS